MPPSQGQPFNKAEGIENENAQKRQQKQCGKHGGYLKAVAGLNNAPGQSGAGSGPGHKFGHHCADKASPPEIFAPSGLTARLRAIPDR